MKPKLSKYISKNKKYLSLMKQYSEIDYNYPDLIQSKYIAHRPAHKLYIAYTTYKFGNSYVCYCVTFDSFNHEIIHFDVGYDDKPQTLFETLDRSLQHVNENKNSQEETIIHFPRKWQFNSDLFRDICIKNNIKMSSFVEYSKTNNTPVFDLFRRTGELFINAYIFEDKYEFAERLSLYLLKSNDSFTTRVYSPYIHRKTRGWEYLPYYFIGDLSLEQYRYKDFKYDDFEDGEI